MLTASWPVETDDVVFPCEAMVHVGNNEYRPCGKEAPYVVDPFIREIYGETEWRYLCDYHFMERADDI